MCWLIRGAACSIDPASVIDYWVSVAKALHAPRLATTTPTLMSFQRIASTSELPKIHGETMIQRPSATLVQLSQAAWFGMKRWQHHLLPSTGVLA